MRGAFGGYLGPEMKDKAKEFAQATPNPKQLPQHVAKQAKRGALLKHMKGSGC